MKTLIRILIKKKLKISFAESCTGGLLSSKITSISGASKISEVEIFNALGDKVIHRVNEMSGELLEFDLSNKTRGIYFVKIISGEKLINYKIVLQ